MVNISGGTIIWTLDADDSKLKDKLDKAGVSAKNLESKFKDAEQGSQVFAAGLAVVGAAAIGFGISSVKAFDESQQVLGQLNAVLTSTKSAAGVTAKQVTTLATALQQQTGVSDEATISASNMLLTFTNIGHKIFPDTTKTVLDMATAMNGGLIPSAESLRGTSILLGKALQDPDAGLGALHRVGVNVDELKKKFTDSMSVEDKQILILKELQTEFGGSAKAAGQTFAGQIAIATANFNDFQELVGESIKNRLEPLVEAFNNWQKSMGGPEGMMRKLNEVFTAVSANLPIIIGFIVGGLTPALVGAAIAAWGLIAPLIPFIAIGTAVGIVVKVLNDNFDLLGKGLPVVIGLLSAVGVVLVATLAPAIAAAVTAFGAWAVAAGAAAVAVIAATWPLLAIAAAVGVAVAAVVFLASNWSTVWAGIKAVTADVFTFLTAGFNALVATLTSVGQFVVGIVQVLATPFVWLWQNVYEPILLLLEAIFLRIFYEIFQFAQTQITNFIAFVTPAFQAISNLISTTLNGIKTIFTTVWNAITSATQAAWNTISNAISGPINTARNTVNNAINSIASFLSGTWNNIYNFFAGMGGRILDAITQPFRDAKAAIERIAQQIRDAANNINPFVRHSPSLVDNVTRGIGIIKDQYASLKDITLPSMSGLMPTPSFAGEAPMNVVGGKDIQGGGGANQNINIYIDKVNDKQDIDAIGRELGVRAALAA